MRSQELHETLTRSSTEEIRGSLIRLLKRQSVRKDDIIVPMMLILWKNREAMIQMIEYIVEKNPTEHEIIQMMVEIT